MDRKKVIELIKKGISYWNRSTYITSYEDDAKECFNEAIKELSKSDWISVEDWLPPYEQNVEVRSTEYPNDVWTSFRRENVMYNHDFVSSITRGRITHWKPIEKLEE